MSKIKRIYMAGPLTPKGNKSANSAIEYLLNVRDLIRESLKVYFAGYSPFCPALDMLFFLSLQNGERITEPMIKKLSKDWLEVCDAVLLTKGWRNSVGTLKEIEYAKKLNIPVFETLYEMKEYDKGE